MKKINHFKILEDKGSYYNSPFHRVYLVQFGNKKREIAVVFTGSSLEPIKQRGYIRWAYMPSNLNIPMHTWRNLERALLSL